MKSLCPILGRVTEVRPINYSSGAWQLARCAETGLVFLLNPPSYDDVAEQFAWQKTFADERQKRRDREPFASRLSGRFKRWRNTTFYKRDKMLSLALRDSGQKEVLSILDVGSGRGERIERFCRRLQQRGIRVVPVGIEISSELAAISNSAFAPFGGSVVADSAIDGMTRFPDQAFDIVIMSCYLEHEARPLEVLRRTRAVVKEDGVVLVKVPNFNSVNRICRGRRWCGFRFPDHVNYFTPATLRILAEQAGYDMQPQHLSDRLPTSDNMYAVLKKGREAERATRRAA